MAKIIKFGNYPQNNGNAREPIEWLVLQVRGNAALLVSRYALDCRQYHHEQADITWENCDLRKWLNEDFLKEAFSEVEQQRILGCFCLSLAEAERYFKGPRERKCQPTALAKAHGAIERNGRCDWWLRTPGDFRGCSGSALNVYSDGALSLYGSNVKYDGYAVRPALRLIMNR